MTIRNDKDGHPIYDQTRLDFTDIELNTEQLLDYAVINYKNTTCVEDARIILMGEQHKTPKHRDLEVAIINQFGKDRDVFLLEGTEYEEFIPDPNTNYGIYGNISKKIHMRGWEENLSLGIESLKLVKGINTKKLEIITEEKQSFERGISPNQEKMQKSHDEAFELFHQFMEILHERNNFLIRSIKRASIEHPHSKIFVFTGRLHILEVGTFNLLDHMLENEKCAALLFKE
ncbi:hypothetical protein PNK_2221 [Candidatus Protochlamydia naegleriophila]|uniref:Haem-binding uptake Tiki superfamily ChaN domain-containing protein n=2 Tax=Candidatus Protochlamydia naegleriophila TaxID=389348 RepID=A0A0U5JE79_9BACT|nr:hypothetical protein PNK_2221 [Candidatus Protochlamydia naegleriophila]